MFLAPALLAMLAPTALQAQSTIFGAFPFAIPAGTPGVTLQVEGDFPTSTQTAFCFYTGFGSKAPILVDTSNPGANSYNVPVPASTIQQIPPTSFPALAPFSAVLYVQTSTTVNCTGIQNESISNNTTVSIDLPSLTNSNTSSLPQPNPALGGVPAPKELYLNGTGFLPGQESVTFTGSFGTLTPTVTDVNTATVKVDVPALPASATSVTVKVCVNDPSFSYCTNTINIPVNGLTANPGTLVASPNPAAPNAQVTVSASFGSSTAGVGIPSGLATFMEGATTLGTAQLSVAFEHFVAAPSATFGSNTSAATFVPILTDLNKDGLTDVVLVDPSAGQIDILVATDNLGDFADESSPFQSDALPSQPLNRQVAHASSIPGTPRFILHPDNDFCGTLLSATVADLNGDGYPDIAVLCKNPAGNGSNILTYLNQGDGTFKTFGEDAVTSAPLAAKFIVAGDFNKDTKQDVLITAQNALGSPEFVTYFGDGAGNFPTSSQSPMSLANIQQLVGVDLNNDGFPDLIVAQGTAPFPAASVTQSAVFAFQNDGTGKFPSTPTYSRVFGDGHATPEVLVNKLPGNPFPALAVVLGATNQLLDTVENSGTATINFTNAFQSSVPNIQSAALGDFNGNGYLDVVTFDGTNIEVFANATNSGEISGTPIGTLTTAASRVQLLGASDPNGDGYADLLTVTPGDANGDPPFLQQYITSGTATASIFGNTFALGAHNLTATTPGTATLASGSASTTLNSALDAASVFLTVVPPSPTTFSPTGTEMLNVDIPASGGPNPTGTVQFFDGATSLGMQALTLGSGESDATITVGPLTAGTHSLTAVYSGDATYASATSAVTTYVVNKGTPVVAWTPTTLTITFGTGLGAAQLNATATVGGTAVAGTFTYKNALGAVVTTGTILPAGSNVLTVSFVPTDTTDYSTPAAGPNATITVGKATPVLAWTPTTPTITFGTGLGAGQLNAAATNGGTAVAGTFTYREAGVVVTTGSVLPVGPNALTASFVPTDTTDYNTPAGSASATITVTKATPSDTLTVSPVSPTTYSPTGNETLTATLAGTTPPTGSVQFFDGATSLGTATVVVSTTTTATLPTSEGLTAGTHSLTAVYSGDGNYTTVTSSPVSYVVNQATPVLAWTPTTPTITVGTALSAAQLNATAKVGGTTVAGTFTYKNASGTVVTTGTVLPAGANVLTVTFVPTDTTDFSTPTGVNATITVNKVNPGITLAVLPVTPTIYSPTGNETLTANLTTGTSPLPTGTVQFFDGATSLGTGTVVVATSSTATITTTTPLTGGTHSLTAVYSGDGMYNTVTSATTNYTVNKATVVLAWTPTTPTITFGTGLGAAQLNATATVGGTAVAGTFTYKTALGATVTTGTVLPVGGNALTVGFVPTDTTDFNTPAAVGATITVNKANSTTALTVNPVSPTTYSPTGNETLTANVTVSGTPLATGTITFENGTPVLGTGTLVAGTGVSTASFTTTTPLTAGTHTLTALYSGDGNYNTGSSVVTYVVNKATPVLAWTPTISSITVGTPLGAAQLNATATVGGTSVAGTFTYKNASGTTVSSGSVLPVGPNPLTVTFVPTDTTDYNTPTGAVGATITVNTSPSTVMLTVTPTSPTTYSPTGNEVLNVTVTGASVATGTVQFFDGATSLGTLTLLAGDSVSTASLTVPPLSAGTHALTAAYSGDSNNSGATSAVTTYVVNQITTVLTWIPNPATLPLGTGLSAAQLNAAATASETTVNGTFVYTNASGTPVTIGTVLPAGANILTVTFTPTDSVNYTTPAPVQATITVAQAAPMINSVDVISLPVHNPDLTGVPAPRAIYFEGTGFTPGEVTATFSGSFTSFAGTVSGSLGTFARVDVPATLPAGATSLNVTICNHTTPTDFCAEPVTIPLTALAANPGTLSASNNPTTAAIPTSLQAVFGSATSSVGVPSGLVTFQDGTTTLGTAPLVLASGQFVASPTSSLLPGDGDFEQSNPAVFADLHHDGLQDVLIPGFNSVAIFPAANNLGAFGNPAQLQLDPEACNFIDGVVSGDFNGDGYPDVAVLCFGGETFQVPFVRGNSRKHTVGHSHAGKGQIQPQDQFGQEQLYIFINQGDGTFTAPQHTYDVPSADLLATASFKNNGRLDLVIAGPDGNMIDDTTDEIGINVYPGDGTGNFNTDVAPIPAPLADGFQIAAIDLNNDGFPDLAMLNTTFESGSPTPIVVFQNDGTGNFPGTPAAQLSFGDGSSTTQFFTRTLLGSQYPDLIAVTEGTQPGFSVALNSKTPSIGFGTPSLVSVPNIFSAAIGDFTGDGYPDIATYDGSNILVFNSDTNGQYSTPLASFTNANQNLDGLVGATDPNADGYADLLTLTFGGDSGDALQQYITSGTASASLPGMTFSGGVHNLTATTPGTTTLTPGTASLSLTSESTTPTVTLTVVPNSPTTYSPTGTEMLNADLTITFGPSISGSVQFFDGATSLGTMSVTVVSGGATAAITVGPLSGGTHSLTAVYSGDSNFTTASSAVTSYVVNKATPVITWTTPAAIAFGTPLSATQLNATSTLGGVTVPGTFSYNPAAGTVLTGGSHTLNVTFTPTDTTDYNTATGSTTITVGKSTPVITWPTPASIAFGTALSATQLDATASFGGTAVPGTFIYSPAAGTVLSAGPQMLGVTFTPTDSTDFNTATGSVTITVTKSTPVITWVTPSPIPFGTALSGTQLDATASFGGTAVAGTFSYNPPAGTVLAAGSHTLNVTFTPTDGTDFTTASGGVTLAVGQSTPVITWATPAPISFGTALSATQLNATASFNGNAVAGTFTYNPAAGTVLAAGSHTLGVIFTPSDTADFSTATGSVTLTVSQSAPVITWATPAPIAFGTALSATQLNASAAFGGTAVAGTFAYTPTAGTVLSAGSHTLGVTFTPTDATDFTTATGSVTLVVGKSTPVITWATPAGITYGTALSATQLNATAAFGGTAVAGTFTYNPAAGTVLSAGSHTLGVTFTPTDAADFNVVTGSVTLAVGQSTPVIAWTPPAAITAGTPLSATQLNATATGAGGVSLPGVFTYNPVAGTVLGPGATTLNVSFVPTDAVDYTNASASVPLTVNPAVPTITVASGTNPSQFGQSVTFTVTLTSSFTATPITGQVAVFDGSTLLGTPTISNGSATVTTSALTVGTHNITASFAGNSTFAASTSAALVQTVNAATTIITWAQPAGITYGTPLSATQLNATASTANATTVPGVFTYTPPAGTVLTAGTQTLSVLFTPTDTASFKTATSTVTIVVGKISPTLSWATPGDLVVGDKLSATQLNATATGVGGVALPGTFVYTPPAGTVVTAGQQTLSVVFTPTDVTDYTTATTTVPLNVVGVALTSLSQTTALLGDPQTTLTLTGTGFVAGSVVSIDGVAANTTFVNRTTLTAVIPASSFTTIHNIPVFVTDPVEGQTTNTLNIAVTAPPVSVTLTGPSTITPTDQPTLNFALPHAYPVPITATFTVTFTPATGLPNDPTVMFANGSTTYSFVIPAGTTNMPPVQLQGGSVAGTVTVTLVLSAGGQVITPVPAIQPLVISAPPAIPGIISAKVTRTGSVLTVEVTGYSNIREIDHVNFHFIAAAGKQLATSDITIQGADLFAPYYASAVSQTVGSGFIYDQTFNLDQDASVVGQVQVTLVSTAGNSLVGNSQ